MEKEDPFKSADALIQERLEVFLTGFNQAVNQQLEEIIAQAENLQNVIKTSNMDQPK